MIIYLIVFGKNIFLLEKSNGNFLEDIISYNNNLDNINKSINFSESIRVRDAKFNTIITVLK